MARRVGTARIKVHLNYEIAEAAEVTGVTPQTVRQWIRQGLPALTEKRPYLILGWQLKAFLKARETGRRRPLQDGEFFCLSCKAPRRAALGMTETAVRQDGRSVLKGFCADCETLCLRLMPGN